MKSFAVMPVALAICACAGLSKREELTVPQPLVFLKSPEAAYAAVVAAADSMSWEILQGDENTGVVQVRIAESETDVTITVVSRPDGLKEIRLEPMIPEVKRHMADFATYMRRALYPMAP